MFNWKSYMPKGIGQKSHSKKVHGQRLVVSLKNDAETEALTQYVLSQSVDAEFKQDLTPRFGVLNSVVENDGENAARARHTMVIFDYDDLYTLDAKDRKILDSLGAGQAITKNDWVDATEGLPDPPEETLLRVDSSIQRIDRAHAKQSYTDVSEWCPRVSINEMDARAQGGRTRTTKQVVANDFEIPASDNTFNTIDLGLAYLGKAKKEYTKVEVLDDYIDLNSEEEEPETGLKVSVTRELRNAKPVITAGTARIVDSQQRVDRLRWLLTQREIEQAILYDSEQGEWDVNPTVWTEYHNVRYYFPSYLNPDAPFDIANHGAGGYVLVTNRSSDHNFSVPCRFEITYHAVQPNADEVFQFKPIDMKLQASTHSIVNERDVLVDGGTLRFYHTFNNADGESEGIHINYEFPDSSPTATEYLELMGTEVLIGSENSRWKFNLWKRVKIYMTIPNLQSGLGGSLIY